MAAPGLLSRESAGDPRQQSSLVESDRSTVLNSHPPRAPAFDFDIAIVGLGYVGLPTALAFHAAGSGCWASTSASAGCR